MKTLILSFFFAVSTLSFTSFTSENRNKSLPLKVTSRNENSRGKSNLARNKENKENKISFKEKIALKLIQRKIKKAVNKNTKRQNNKSIKGENFESTAAFLLIIGVITGIILTIISLILGNFLIALGIFLVTLLVLWASILISIKVFENSKSKNNAT